MEEQEKLLFYIPPQPGTSNYDYGSTSISDQERFDGMDVQQESSRNSNAESSRLPQYIATLAATLGAFASGTVLAYTSPTSDELKKGALGFKISKSNFNWVGSLTPLGAMVMCIPVGSILDMIGRKITMLAVILVFTVGWALIIWATEVEMLMAGRFLTGLAGGTFCVAAPLYTSEIAEKEIRGILGSYFQLMVTLGILFTYVLGYFVNPQVLAIISIVVPFIFGLAFVFMPESPVYLLKKGNEEKAKSNLQWLRGKKYNIDEEIKSMKDNLAEDGQNPISIRDSLKKKATQKALIIGFGLMVFQQLSGINAVVFYTSEIFKNAGADLDPKVSSIIIGTMQFLATYASTLVIDRLCRRSLLLLSASVMAICAMLLGIFFYLKDHVMNAHDIKTIGFLPIVSLSIFVIVFSLGFGPIPWMITAEVFPREIKSIASSGAGTLNWFLAFLVTHFFNELSSNIGSDVTFFLFMAISILGTVFVFFFVIETKGKTLEQIQIELGGESPTKTGIVNEGFTK